MSRDSLQDNRDRSATRPTEQRVFILGIASLAVALLCYGTYFIGGLLAMPISTALAIVSCAKARRRQGPARKARAGVVMAGMALILGVHAYLNSWSVTPSLQTDSAAYAAGDVVAVQLRSGLRGVGYNLCFMHLERREAHGWRQISVGIDAPADPTGPITICTTQMDSVPIMFAANSDYQLPRTLRSGSYRLVTNVEVAGDRREIASIPFSLTG